LIKLLYIIFVLLDKLQLDHNSFKQDRNNG